MKRSADVKASRRAVGAGIVPLCPGWAELGDEASQAGEVRVAPTFRSAATVLDDVRVHAGTFGSRSLWDEDRSVSRTRPPALSVLTSSALRHCMQHVVVFSASIRRDGKRVARPPAPHRLASFCFVALQRHHLHCGVTMKSLRAITCLPKCLNR
jgi:hypothetical protein